MRGDRAPMAGRRSGRFGYRYCGCRYCHRRRMNWYARRQLHKADRQRLRRQLREELREE